MAQAIVLAAVCIGAITWGVYRPAKGPQAGPLFTAPPVSAPKASAAVAANPPAQPGAAAPTARQSTVPKPPDPKKQVPRVDLVIHYISDTRGNVEPCG